MKIPRRKYIQAMALLEREGWCKREWISRDTGARCLDGAFCKTVFGDERVSSFYIETDLDAYAFNDAPETTYEDVLTLLAFGAAGAFE